MIMRYTDPDARVVLIDGDKMTMSWPGRNLTQVTDIGTAQGRIQKYFVNGTAAELRDQFAIDDHGMTGDRSRPLLRHDGAEARNRSAPPSRSSTCGSTARRRCCISMKMTFANGDTKTLAVRGRRPERDARAGQLQR